MLLLDDLRKEFAEHLSADPAKRFALDQTFAHCLELAYRQGLRDGQFMARAFDERATNG